MNTQIPISVYLEAVKAGDDLVRVDVKIKNVPEDLFGAAFHLKAEGVAWSLQKFETGDVFVTMGGGVGVSGAGMQVDALSFAPLTLAEERLGKNGVKEIIFGTSLKRTDEVKARDGTIVSFYLQIEGRGADLQLYFTDAHLSVLNESRRDIENVVFESGTINTGDLPIAGAELQANLLLSSQNVRETYYYPEVGRVYLVMLFCLIFLLVSTASYYLYKRWKRMRD